VRERGRERKEEDARGLPPRAPNTFGVVRDLTLAQRVEAPQAFISASREEIRQPMCTRWPAAKAMTSWGSGARGPRKPSLSLYFSSISRFLNTSAALIATTLAFPALADVEPVPSPEDARIAIVHYQADQPVRLNVASGGGITILLPLAEHIQSVVLTDPEAWHVDVSGGQDSLSLREVRQSLTGSTVMTVRSDMRSYDFSLTSSARSSGPYLVRIETAQAGRPPAVWSPPVISEPGTYKLAGNKALIPATLRDDGSKMYMTWGASQAIPAVFAIDDLGQEQMVNGYMRDGTFTIDRIYDQLLFRIDGAEASARRLLPKRKR